MHALSISFDIQICEFYKKRNDIFSLLYEIIIIRNELFSKFQMLTINIFRGSMAGIGIINNEDNYNVCLFSVTLE